MGQVVHQERVMLSLVLISLHPDFLGGVHELIKKIKRLDASHFYVGTTKTP